MKGNRIKCPRESCGYEWVARVVNPRECPMCKQYRDFEIVKDISLNKVKTTDDEANNRISPDLGISSI